MFVGELMCLLLYVINRKFINKPTESQLTAEKLQNFNPLLVSIPAMCDIMCSTLMFIALTMCAASVYQMLRGFIVVITAFMSVIFLGRKQYAHHWTSLFTIVAGVALVGIVSVNASKSHGGDEETSTTGIVILMAAMAFGGAMMIVEEKILKGNVLDPLYVVGFEGFWGCCVFAILLPIFQQVKCEGALCHNGQLEDSVAAYNEARAHPIIFLQCLA